MKKGTIILLVVSGIILIGALSIFSFIRGSYNSIVRLDETVSGAWANVETDLQRRFDLIPNLVNTVKGFAEQEKDVLMGVTNARARVGGAGNVPDKMSAENELSGALSRLLMVVENYPVLKSNANFIALQDELAGTENRIAVSRKRYNEAVKIYNMTIRQFPQNFIANTYGFEKREFFKAPEAAATAPQVEF